MMPDLVILWVLFPLFNLLDCGNSFIKTNGMNFTRYAALDGYACTSESVIYLGRSRSKIECFEACAEMTQCKSFFYNPWDHTCDGSTLIHQDTHGCYLKMETVYYISNQSGETPFSCDTGWIEYDGHCYKKNTQVMTWREAQTDCQDLGGYLLSIETEQENQAMTDTFPNGDFWIGGSDDYADTRWRWETSEFLTYTNWDPGEPSDSYSHSDCMLVKYNWKWHDMNCYSTYQSICEKEPSY